MKAINETAKADQRFLVLDSGIGQQASEQAKAFNEAIGLTGVVVTKLDGTAKGAGRSLRLPRLERASRLSALAKPSTTSRSSNQTDSSLDCSAWVTSRPSSR